MAYQVAQIRKQSGSKTYMLLVMENLEESYVLFANPFGQGYFYKDFALKGKSDFNFLPGKVYYLRFKIHKIPQYFYSGDNSLDEVKPIYYPADVLNLTVLLSNKQKEGEDKWNYQLIGTCEVPIKPQTEEISDYSTFTFVFSPVAEFKYLAFKIQRNTYDAIENQTDKQGQVRPDGLFGRTWLLDQFKASDDYESLNVTKEINVGGQQQNISTRGRRIIWNTIDWDQEENGLGLVSELKDLIDTQIYKTGWLKLGYQSRPGGLIVINREPIRVGRSGIFLLNNGTRITNFMVASPNGSDNSKIDAFLLDYAYDSEEV